MFISLLLLPLVFRAQSFAARLPASGALTNGSASTSNATHLAGSIGYPPDGQPFYPTPPNPLFLLYRDRLFPPRMDDIPIPLIGECVDDGLQRVEVLITVFGEDARIRPDQMDGDFRCDMGGQNLNIQFFPQLAEPTYQEVEWGLLAIKEASLYQDVNYHQEATIFAKDLRPVRPPGRFYPVSRIEMFLSDDQTEPVALTK